MTRHISIEMPGFQLKTKHAKLKTRGLCKGRGIACKAIFFLL